MHDVRVASGRKIAVVAHCLLNQNTKPHQRARFPGIATPVLDAVQKSGFALMQLPCPEISFAGTRRWSQVIEQYDTPAYRHHCRVLSRQSVDQIDHFLRDQAFTIAIIALEGSPSCGYRYTGSSDTWRGFPGDAEFDGTYPVVKGTGLFMQALVKEIACRDLPVPPILGVALDVYGVDLDTIQAEIEAGLKELT